MHGHARRVRYQQACEGVHCGMHHMAIPPWGGACAECCCTMLICETGYGSRFGEKSRGRPFPCLVCAPIAKPYWQGTGSRGRLFSALPRQFGALLSCVLGIVRLGWCASDLTHSPGLCRSVLWHSCHNAASTHVRANGDSLNTHQAYDFASLCCLASHLAGHM